MSISWRYLKTMWFLLLVLSWQYTKYQLPILKTLTVLWISTWKGGQVYQDQPPSPAILHLVEFANIKSISELYEECHVTAYISCRVKGDHKVNHAIDSKLNREKSWTHKQSTAVLCNNTYKAIVPNGQPDIEKLSEIKAKAKSLVHTKHQKSHWDHLTTLICQGEFFRIWEIQEEDFEWKADIHNLPRGVSKFLLNSVLTTLPTRDNLQKWGKVLSAKCDLCGSKETVGHVLSGCHTMLKQGRYTWRHDSFLSKILDQIVAHRADNTEIYCDINKTSWAIPPDILCTSDRPDLVAVNRDTKLISILELTVPFERNIHRQHCDEYKRHKYIHMIVHMLCSFAKTWFQCQIFCIWNGVRGLLSHQNSCRLRAFLSSIPGFKFSSKEFKSLVKSLRKIAVTASFIIFKSKFHNNPTTTPLIYNL